MRGVSLLYPIALVVIAGMIVLNVLVPRETHGMTQEVPEQTTDVTTLFAETLELPSLIRVAVDRNPKVNAAKARWQAIIEQYPQVTALPDPMFM